MAIASAPLVEATSKSFNEPNPPLEITGMFTVSVATLSRSLSKPLHVPSLSTEVISNSPAPRSSPFFIQFLKFKSVFSLPDSI